MKRNADLELIHTQLMWNRLIAVVEEQAQTLVRTAFSTAVRECGDLSAGVFDLGGRMLAQAVTGTPGHVNAMAASVNHFRAKFPPETMNEGDVFLTNDPWLGTGHLNDFTVVTPAFRRGRVVALLAATCHVVDIGGVGFGPDGRQVFEEGLNIPIMPLAEKGVINRTLLDIVAVNVREPVQVEGDLYSLAACNDMGCKRLVEMMAEFELDSLDRLADSIIAQSRAAMIAEIRKVPPGTYENRMRIDGYDSDIGLVATMTVARDHIAVDFAGTSGVSGYGINVPITYTQAYASFGVRCVVGARIPNNAGSLAPVRVTAPEGTILNAPRPSAVAARHVIGQMLPDVVLGCLDQALADAVPAEGASCLWIPILMGGHGTSDDAGPTRSEPFTVALFHTGGTGARPGKDGMSATAFPSGVRSTPVEVNEAIAPIVIWRKEYICDSGGAGEMRGGAGQVMEIGHADGAPFVLSAMFDRIAHPARGRRGGHKGAAGRVSTTAGAALRGKGRQAIAAGDRLVLEIPGGGGLGDPLRRAPDRVAEDVANGMVSRRAAKRDYAVMLTPQGAVDAAKTRALRARKKPRATSRAAKSR